MKPIARCRRRRVSLIPLEIPIGRRLRVEATWNGRLYSTLRGLLPFFLHHILHILLHGLHLVLGRSVLGLLDGFVFYITTTTHQQERRRQNRSDERHARDLHSIGSEFVSLGFFERSRPVAVYL